jgi:hypothetical protein
VLALPCGQTRRRIQMKLGLPLAAVVLAAVALPLSGGCSNSLDPNECLKLRVDAFELLNKAQHCNNDADCRQSDWPGCAKPMSMETHGKIQPMKASFTKGKCQEPKAECREPPEVYCKQGLCVHREKGTPEGAGNTPLDQIIIK